MIPYPNISPNIVSFGDFHIRWYSMMYVLGYIIAFRIIRHRVRTGFLKIEERDVEVFLPYYVFSMVIGARVFYVLFYNLQYYLQNPFDVFKVWHGGLSFHGAAVGLVVASFLLSRRFKIPFFSATDTLAIAAGPGLFLGRMGNFINAELYGRVTDVPWAMVFPSDPTNSPRHPSQIYQGLTEGLLLFFFLWWLQSYLVKKGKLRVGHVGAAFLMGYGFLRFITEFTREPDSQLGLFWSFLSMGQILCLVMIAFGLWCLWLSKDQDLVILQKVGAKKKASRIGSSKA